MREYNNMRAWNKGLKNCYSQETLHKMSIAKKGKVPKCRGVKPNIKIDTTTLESLYLKEKLSIKKIAKILGYCEPTISKCLKKSGITLRTASEEMKNHPVTWGDKIGEANKGRKLSAESRKKISETRKTKKIKAWNAGLYKCNNPKLKGLGKAGKEHWNWKGGISSINAKMRASSDYKAYRNAVFARDNYTCQFCEHKGGNLAAHHIIPMRVLLKNNDKELLALIFDPVNGYTLCETCHKTFHKESGK